MFSNRFIEKWNNLGHLNIAQLPVVLLPSICVQDRNWPQFTAPRLENMQCVPIALGKEDIRRREQTKYELSAGIMSIFQALKQPGEVYSCEYALTPGKFHIQVIASNKQNANIIQDAVEGALPYSQALTPLSICKDSFTKNLSIIQKDNTLQRAYRLVCYDLCPQEPPFRLLIPSVYSDSYEHPWQGITSLPANLQDFEVLNIRILFTIAPQSCKTMLNLLHKHIHLDPHPKYDRLRKSDDERLNKSGRPNSIYACRICITGILKRENVPLIRSQIFAMCDGFHFGSQPFKIATLKHYVGAGCSLSVLCDSLVRRLTHNEGFLLTDLELGNLFPLPNLAMISN